MLPEQTSLYFTCGFICYGQFWTFSLFSHFYSMFWTGGGTRRTQREPTQTQRTCELHTEGQGPSRTHSPLAVRRPFLAYFKSIK